MQLCRLPDPAQLVELQIAVNLSDPLTEARLKDQIRRLSSSPESYQCWSVVSQPRTGATEIVTALLPSAHTQPDRLMDTVRKLGLRHGVRRRDCSTKAPCFPGNALSCMIDTTVLNYVQLGNRHLSS